MTLYFSHIRFERSPSARALASLLRPDELGQRISVQHHLLWSVFADSAERRRDFLWREEDDGSFLTLSGRPPLQSDLFLPHQIKPYEPELALGDRLDFLLHANATRMKREGKLEGAGKKPRGKRVDVVMDALHSIERSERASRRMEIATSEGKAWLERQGEKSGFQVIEAVAEDYSTVILPRLGTGRDKELTLGILDLSGCIEVTDPELFLVRMTQGFGRAKSFGCGLMLIRRAR